MVRVQRVLTELPDRFGISHVGKICVIPCLDLLDLVGCTEAVEEIDERKAALQRRKMGDRGQIHHFLDGGFAEHAAACLAARIDVGMIAEDAQRMAGDRTGGNIEHARKLLARHLVQIRDHQQKALGRREGGRQSARRQRAVIGARGARLGLHLGDLDFLTEDILAACRRPFIHVLRHDR